MRHGRLLAFSAFCALFGCTALLAAGSRFGVVVGILLTGAGFSAIYPLVAERIASRFSYYHPGYFNGIFTFALMGGILAPFVLGHMAAGVRLEGDSAGCDDGELRGFRVGSADLAGPQSLRVTEYLQIRRSVDAAMHASYNEIERWP